MLQDSQGRLHPKYDYELLLRDLQTRMRGALEVKVLDTISTPDPDACGTSVILLLLSRATRNL
jgi:hypothetical protein